MPLEDFFLKKNLQCKFHADNKRQSRSHLHVCRRVCVYDAPPHIEEHYLYELTGKEPV